MKFGKRAVACIIPLLMIVFGMSFIALGISFGDALYGGSLFFAGGLSTGIGLGYLDGYRDALKI